MIVKNIFTSFLAYEQNLNFDNIKLNSYCKEKIYSSERYINTNLKQSDALDLTAAAVKPLFDHVIKLSNELKITCGLHKDLELEIQRAWANLNNSEAIDHPHSHANSLFSGVYYVNGDNNCGNLNLLNPVDIVTWCIPQHYVTSPNNYNCSEQVIFPETGTLIMFPSWIKHYVKPSDESKERISIAFDINYKGIRYNA
jgi:uncharacterized protein (TIGR02466 family)